MTTTTRNLIEYNGLNSCNHEDLSFFNQVIQDFTFCIPVQKPDIEQIVKVWAKVCILQHKIVKTPKGTSLEGQHLTGFKLMIEGDIQFKIQYVADEETQSLHTAHTTIPFCGSITLPKKFNPNSIITVSALLEDIHTEQLDKRCVYNNITLLLIADLC